MLFVQNRFLYLVRISSLSELSKLLRETVVAFSKLFRDGVVMVVVSISTATCGTSDKVEKLETLEVSISISGTSSIISESAQGCLLKTNLANTSILFHN